MASEFEVPAVKGLIVVAKHRNAQKDSPARFGPKPVVFALDPPLFVSFEGIKRFRESIESPAHRVLLSPLALWKRQASWRGAPVRALESGATHPIQSNPSPPDQANP